MPELNAAIAAEVVAACRAGLAEALGALGRTLDVALEGTVGESMAFDLQRPELAGLGLAVQMGVGGKSALAVLAEASGLLPAWIAAPDATGTSKLATLAQELSMLLLPETLMAEEFLAARVDDLRTALTAAAPETDAQCIPLELKSADGRTGTMLLVFACSAGAKAFAAAPGAAAPPPSVAASAMTESAVAVAPAAAVAPPLRVAPKTAAAPSPVPRPHAFDDLPPYARSLLKIKVPVVVTLARKKQPISKILEIGPGSILQFTKSCDQLLELEVNGRAIGAGEAVKVGDKFGLRVVNLTLPGEQFKSVKASRKP